MTASLDTATAAMTPRLCTSDGRVLDLPVDRWFGPADAAELRALEHAVGPALDIGCGPGRHLVALKERHVFALGLDISSSFLDIARGRGVNVLQRSVFERVPGSRRWRSALLFDGNIGIGGDPTALLCRIAELLRDDGRIIVETEVHDGSDDIVLVRAETVDAVGPWFHWTTVGPRRLRAIADTLGLEVVESWEDDERAFARLDIRP
jgi:SAM-dependent methyltransferase